MPGSRKIRPCGGVIHLAKEEIQNLLERVSVLKEYRYND